MKADRLWSKSWLISAIRCGLRFARQQDAPEVTNARMTRGRLLAEMDAAAKRNDKSFGNHDYDATLWDDCCDAYNPFREAVPLGPLHLYVNVEEDNVSPVLRSEKEYDGVMRPNFEFAVGSSDYRVCGARDSVRLMPDFSAYRVDDTKSGDYMEPYAKRIEQLCYGIATMLEFPTSAVEVVQQYIDPPHESQPVRFEAEQLAELMTELAGYCDQAEAATKAAIPSLNKYCDNCPVSDCKARALALSVAPAPLVLSALTFGGLEEMDAQLLQLGNMAQAQRDRIDAEEKRRLADGPVSEGADEWYLGDRTTSYDRPVAKIAAMASTAQQLGEITEKQFGALFKVDAKGLDALKKPAPELHARIVAVSSPVKCVTVKKRAAQQSPALPVPALPAMDGEATPAPGRDGTGAPIIATGPGSCEGPAAFDRPGGDPSTTVRSASCHLPECEFDHAGPGAPTGLGWKASGDSHKDHELSAREALNQKANDELITGEVGQPWKWRTSERGIIAASERMPQTGMPLLPIVGGGDKIGGSLGASPRESGPAEPGVAQPDPGRVDEPAAGSGAVKPKRHRRPSPVCPKCAKRSRYERQGAATAYCATCAEVFSA